MVYDKRSTESPNHIPPSKVWAWLVLVNNPYGVSSSNHSGYLIQYTSWAYTNVC